MKKLFIALAIVGCTLTIPTQAHAIFIIDTGPGGSEPFAPTLRNSSANSFQFLAGQFTTAQPYNIHSLEGWIRGPHRLGGTVDAVIYGDSSNSVNEVDEILRENFTIPILTTDDPDWYGATGLNHHLSPGKYWLALEPDLAENGGFGGSMPNLAPAPLDRYAVRGAFTGGYIPIPDQLGFRIDASEPGPSTNVIPEPATMLLFGGGMAGMFLRRRKKA